MKQHPRRREVLLETIAAFEQRGDELRARARENLARWKAAAKPTGPKLRVLSGDWGAVTEQLTREHGVMFAALNMANAFRPGGGYLEGAIAQEENMFRRSDCHFTVQGDRYAEELTALISGRDGRVMLDTASPRTCVRGPEDRAREDLGYPWLEEPFPFVELRAAAQDLRGGKSFDAIETKKRIDAQLETLIACNVRHAVLGAFGCGAFHNPAPEVARLYREALEPRLPSFDCIAFAIFDAGYGPDNFTPFNIALRVLKAGE